MEDSEIYLLMAMPFVTAVLLIGRHIHHQRARDIYLLAWALACFFLHVSTIFVSFFENATSIFDDYWGFALDDQLFPIYFCNLMMYLQLITVGWWNKKTRFFQVFATITAWGGTFGGLITLLFQCTDLGDWGDLQSALSHTCLLITSLYLFVGGYVKLSVYNVIPYAIGLVAVGIVGGIVELLFWSFGLESPNAMYLCHGPEEMPAMQGLYFIAPMLAIIFLIGVLHDFIVYPKAKEKRWYKTAADLTLYFRFRKPIMDRLLGHDSANGSDPTIKEQVGS